MTGKTEMEEIQEMLDLALQVDLEQGVAWLNDEAAGQFSKKYPSIMKAITHILEIETEESNG